MKISDVESSFGPIDAGSTPFSIPFSWIDEFGLVGGQGFKIRVDAVKDQPPVAYIRGLDRQKAILPEETLDFEIWARTISGSEKQGSNGVVTARFRAKNHWPQVRSSNRTVDRKWSASPKPPHFRPQPSISRRNG